MKTQLAIAFIVLVLAITVIARRLESDLFSKITFITLSLAYVLGLLWFTFLSRKPMNEVVVALEPRAIQRFFQITFKTDGGLPGIRIGKIYAQSLQNILLFIPLGFLLPQWELCAFRWSCWNVLLLGGAASLGIELIQFFTHLGWFDVDDILLNVLGALIGYGLYKTVLKSNQ